MRFLQPRSLFASSLLAIAALSTSHAGDAVPSCADSWELVPQVVNTPDWHLWGSSPVVDDAGRYNLFIARWPAKVAWEPGWRRHSEIALYRADKPEGPFAYVRTILKPGASGTGWDNGGMHNPSVKRIGGKYVLVHISNDWKNGMSGHGPNQRIGMRVAQSPEGPWEKVTKDGMILAPAAWCASSGCGVNNPALIQRKDGKFLLYFKARPDAKAGVRMGVAVADKLEGPYVIQDSPVTANNNTIEDGTAFLWDGRICLVTTDNHGIIERGGGLLWISDDGLHFRENPVHAFHPLRSYLTGGVPPNARFHYGRETKFERPQMFTIKGKPAYMFMPSGTSLDGDSGTDVHLLRWKPNVPGDLDRVAPSSGGTKPHP